MTYAQAQTALDVVVLMLFAVGALASILKLRSEWNMLKTSSYKEYRLEDAKGNHLGSRACDDCHRGACDCIYPLIKKLKAGGRNWRLIGVRSDDGTSDLLMVNKGVFGQRGALTPQDREHV